MQVNHLSSPQAVFSLIHKTENTIKERPEWKPRNLALEIAHSKMIKNALKAVREHQEYSPAYATAQEIEESESASYEMTPLIFEIFKEEWQGRRESMEDAHFFKVLDQGLLLGVLDGHDGMGVARHASENFAQKFEQRLKESANVHQVFEHVFDELQQEILKDQELRGGSAVVISYVDKIKHVVYTATLADSEANLYRKIGTDYKSIPLSTVRDWSCQKDADRAAIALGKPEIARRWPLEMHTKCLRFPYAYGLNISRALGDKDYHNYKGKPGIIHKPKITERAIRPGDILVLACDGLKDYVDEAKIVKHIHKENPAKALMDKAARFSMDNVTIIAVKIS